MALLLFIGCKPYAVVKGDSDMASYFLEQYGFSLCEIPCFDSLDDFEEWNEGEFDA